MTNKVFNGSSNNWNTASAWTPTGIPVNGDSVSFANTSTMGVNPTTPVSLYNFDDSFGIYANRASQVSVYHTVITVTGSMTVGLLMYPKVYTDFNFTGELFEANTTSGYDHCVFNACVVYAQTNNAGVSTSFYVTNSLIQNNAIAIFDKANCQVYAGYNPDANITGTNVGIFRQTGGAAGSGGFVGSSADQFFNGMANAANANGIFSDITTSAETFEYFLEQFFTNLIMPVNVTSWNGTPVTGTGPSGGSSSGPSAATIATAVAAAVLSTPENLLATDVTGKVGVNNLPATVALSTSDETRLTSLDTVVQRVIDATGHNTAVTGAANSTVNSSTGNPIVSMVANLTVTPRTNGFDISWDPIAALNLDYYLITRSDGETFRTISTVLHDSYELVEKSIYTWSVSAHSKHGTSVPAITATFQF